MPLSIILTMGSAMINSLIYRLFAGKFNVKTRQICNCLIAGIIVGGTSSYYITNLAFSIFFGLVAASWQMLSDYYIEDKIYKKIGMLTTYGCTLYVPHSILCCLVSLGLSKALQDKSTNNITYTFLYSIPSGIYVCLVSIGIGFGTGILSGLIMSFINGYQAGDYMHDKTEWYLRDGMSA